MTRRQGADQLLLLAVTVSLIAAATSQDNGEKAAQLKSQVSGTLSDAQPFQAASTRVDASASQGLLASSTPGRPTVGGTVQRGILRLGLSSSSRDGYLFVPSSYDPAKGAPMIVALHGSGKGGLDALGVLYDQANSAGGQCTLLFAIPHVQ
uniref:Putative extracellular protein CSOL_100 n=1 Tax=Pseudococcomyxa simplex TaxID=464287 RepID=A0A7L9QEB1_9CHLO|nr:putative extracellular protein CSOL_100 [Pseudococcomyxa simplex]